MKAIILAAGLGSRLAPLTDTTPKSLLPVGGRPILHRQLSAIRQCGLQEVIMVTGYRAEMIKQFIADQFPDLTVTFIHNPDFSTTNTAYSLWLTKEVASGEDFVKFDADVVFQEEILEKLLAAPGDLCFTVDQQINLASEEVKVQLDQNGKILKIGKHISPENAIGESIGIDKVMSSESARLFTLLDELLADTKNRQAYYEAAFEMIIERGAYCTINDITGCKWTEIDSHEDYALANQLFPA
jgi:choline kinase